MRLDHVNALNANLETQALYLEQNAAMFELQASRCKAAARALRNLASTEAAPDDPAIDGVKLALPSFVNPNDPAIMANHARQKAEAVVKAQREVAA